ncbi:MAG: glycosyltransferase family 39 protein [Chloroflexota bacterium]|jgi:hypothetical protein
MKPSIQRRRALVAMAAVLLLAAALRFHLLEAQSFWNDEGNSARLSERSLNLIIEGTASDIHPPLYYLLLHGWRGLAGETEFALRALSALTGVALVAVAYALGRQLAGPGAAVSGALLVALNPALIYYSQEARMYELLAFLALLSTLLLVRYLSAAGRQRTVTLGYVVAAASGLYTHYFFPAVLLAQNLVVLSWLVGRRKTRAKQLRREAGAWAVMMLATLLLYLPWLPIFFRQVGGRASSRPALGSFLRESTAWLTAGPTWPVDESLPIVLAYLLLAVIGLLFGYRVVRQGLSFSIALLATALLPLLMMWILGATQPAYFKFMLVVIPPLSLLAGAGWWWGWFGPPGTGQELKGAQVARYGRRMVMVIVAAPLLWLSAHSVNNMYADPDYARADYRRIANEISAEAHPNAAILLNAANQWEVFTYYYREGEPGFSAPVYPIPRTYPDPGQINAELRHITAGHDRIYALFWGEAQRDPNRLVERWLEENAFKAREEWVGDVRFVTYAVADPAAGEAAVATDLRWGDSITLEGYTLYPESLAAGDIAQVTLFWRSDKPLTERYKVFVHLLDEQGRLVAQHDGEPGGGLVLTTTWQPGETVADNHGLLVPIDVAGGRFTVQVGLYPLGDPGNRLLVETATGRADAYPLGTILVNQE